MTDVEPCDPSAVADTAPGVPPVEILDVRIGPEGAVIVRGDIDLAGGPVLDVVLARADADGASPVVVDVAAVAFIDSSGLRSLLAASRRAGQRGARVVLREPSVEVLRLLEITATTAQFDIEGGQR